MRRDQRRQSVRPVQPLQQLEYGQSIPLVQVSGRFIRQQHARPGDEGPGNRHALLFPSGKLSCQVSGTLRQTNFSQPNSRLFETPRNRLSPQKQRHRYIFFCRKVRQQLMPLPQKTYGAIAKIRKRRFIIGFNSFRFEVYSTACWRV